MKLLFFLFSFTLGAAEVKFLPHMVEHQNIGCPTNAKCSKKMGIIRQQWVSIAKAGTKKPLNKLKSFASSYGVPIPLWGKSGAEKNKDLIIWDSPCSNHNNEELERFSIVNIFSKNLKSLEGKSDLIIPKSILKNRTHTRALNVLRGDAPIALRGDILYYIKEVEGLYYGLELKTSGQLRVVKVPKISNYPHEVTCSKEILEQMKPLQKHANLHKGIYCKNIWDLNTSSYSTMAFGWSCH
ncbi:hypothetical protein A9Q84_02740 [Halobacteriovorax marinus]|uniref:Uncharacterized protein n=1 Tax=Halobacteriovorax marinus TaxID=97084 RepID=A0A1Y5FGS6_9BACT|nr:hypothetical protein A9Q84_02740 [Halobacteriovorax marinus]